VLAVEVGFASADNGHTEGTIEGVLAHPPSLHINVAVLVKVCWPPISQPGFSAIVHCAYQPLMGPRQPSLRMESAGMEHDILHMGICGTSQTPLSQVARTGLLNVALAVQPRVQFCPCGIMALPGAGQAPSPTFGPVNIGARSLGLQSAPPTIGRGERTPSVQVSVREPSFLIW
jgi:hypothetical protein